MPKEFQEMSDRELKTYVLRKSEQIKQIEQLYESYISEKLRAKLEMLYTIEERISDSLIEAAQGFVFKDALRINLSSALPALVQETVENLETQYGDLIDVDESPVKFHNCWGNSVSEGPPATINPELLASLLNSKNEWEEVKCKLLPFMQRYTSKYSDLLFEVIEAEMELDRRIDIREGEAHMNWLLSEFGEEIFPDRD